MTKYLIIVAGGKGLRMGNEIPKQFIEINGLPILMHTINNFLKYSSTLKIILGLPKNHVDYWNNLCEKHNFLINHEIAFGGITRFETVKNCLDKVSENGIVAIHDGVRPFASLKTISNCFSTASNKGNAIPVIEIKDSIRKVDEEKNYSIDRSLFKIVQTPQVFQCKLIKEAYSTQYNSLFTDDASVMENAGHLINLVGGNNENIKITTEEDLKIASIYADLI